MDVSILITNLTNPTLLFFLLGIIATLVKSDLEIPAPTVKFISLYLLFSIGFRGGQELAESHLTAQILYALGAGMVVAAVIPFYTFFILKRRMSISNAGAIAASYGSVSAVTFVAAAAFLEAQQVPFGGHMVAVMALMESPAIIIGVMLMRRYSDKPQDGGSVPSLMLHSVTNGSVLMILGSLLIGLIADTKQAEGIKPFTTDIFKGFLAIFLLEMGMVTAKRIASFRQYGWFAGVFAMVIPFINGCVVAWTSGMFIDSPGDRLIFATLAASASYIAVPAAMRHAAPDADPGLYIPMALGVTFPFNISIGLPLYYLIIRSV